LHFSFVAGRRALNARRESCSALCSSMSASMFPAACGWSLPWMSPFCDRLAMSSNEGSHRILALAVSLATDRSSVFSFIFCLAAVTLTAVTKVLPGAFAARG
jgi:hypothetical protein